MKITAIEIENIRCFKDVPKFQLSENLNIFIGPKNAGKTTLLKLILSLQFYTLNNSDVTIGSFFSHAKLFFSGDYKTDSNVNFSELDWIEIRPREHENDQIHGASLVRNDHSEPFFHRSPEPRATRQII